MSDQIIEGRAVTLVGHGSALGARVRRELAASGYDVRLTSQAARVADALARPGRDAAATLVAVADLALPAHAVGALLWRRRRPLMLDQAARLGRDARAGGITTLVVLSSALLYADDAGGWLDESGPVDPLPETGQAEALERAAEVFALLGGHAVVLRLGWPYGGGDRLTEQVMRAAGKGWLLFDAAPGLYLPTIGLDDAACAAVAALHAPPGLYNVSDGRLRTGQELGQAVAAAAGRAVRPLLDSRWVDGPLLGRSRRLVATAFPMATGWRARDADVAAAFSSLRPARTR
jgi:2-alkyl-3-oxoalkanoate reductase